LSQVEHVVLGQEFGLAKEKCSNSARSAFFIGFQGMLGLYVDCRPGCFIEFEEMEHTCYVQTGQIGRH
jgi:hypothetical protein